MGKAPLHGLMDEIINWLLVVSPVSSPSPSLGVRAQLKVPSGSPAPWSVPLTTRPHPAVLMRPLVVPEVLGYSCKGLVNKKRCSPRPIA